MEAMLTAPGVIGARQAGAGFGGCMVAFVQTGAVEAFSRCGSQRLSFQDGHLVRSVRRESRRRCRGDRIRLIMHMRLHIYRTAAHWLLLRLPLLLVGFDLIGASTDAAHDRRFYLPADTKYSIVDSVQDSVRFTLTKTLQRDSRGHLVSASSFVNPEGQVMGGTISETWKARAGRPMRSGVPGRFIRWADSCTNRIGNPTRCAFSITCWRADSSTSGAGSFAATGRLPAAGSA